MEQLYKIKVRNKGAYVAIVEIYYFYNKNIVQERVRTSSIIVFEYPSNSTDVIIAVGAVAYSKNI
jgi:hypothetical protein